MPAHSPAAIKFTPEADAPPKPSSCRGVFNKVTGAVEGAHWWIIESPGGSKEVVGICKYCEDTRFFWAGSSGNTWSENTEKMWREDGVIKSEVIKEVMIKGKRGKRGRKKGVNNSYE